MTTRVGTTLFFAHNNKVGALEFDCTVSETHSRGATITEHPVEDGANIADHIRPTLARLSLEVCITNTPLTYVSSGVTPAALDVLSGRWVTSPADRANAYLPLVLTGAESKQAASARVKGGLTTPIQPPGGIKIPATPVVATPGQFISYPVSRSYTSLQFVSRTDRVKAVFDVLEELCRDGVSISVQTDLRYYEEMAIASLSAPRTVLDSMVFNLELVEIRKVTSQAATVVPRVGETRAEAEVNMGPNSTADIADGFPVEQEQLNSWASRGIDAAAGTEDR